jgi:hypothetical protein
MAVMRLPFSRSPAAQDALQPRMPARIGARGVVRGGPRGAGLGAGIGAIAVAIVAGCGGAEQPVMRPLPERVTRATLVGPLCDGEDVKCTCREPGQDIGAPELGSKRYEIRLGPTGNELWATLGDMVFYKSAERAEECFYVDLRPGRHPVSLRAHGERGFSARLVVAEQAVQGWYDTFVFDCKTPGHCSMADLDEWHAWVESRAGKVYDPCGSTKVRDLRWQTGRVQELNYPDALQLDLVLDVYKFTPEHGPGEPACAGR